MFVGAFALLGVSAFGQTVLSVASTPGDSVIANGLTGSFGWTYNDVQTGATAGINTAFARNGNGSMMYKFSGATTAKADLLQTSPNGSGGFNPFGTLSNLTSWGYESYMDGSSAVQFHPSARLVLAGTLFTFNQLVFDSSFTSADTWEQNTVSDSSLVWLSRAVTIGGITYGGSTGTQAIQSNPLALGTLKGLLDGGGNVTAIYGFNIGAGSGVNGAWTGAADTLSYSFGSGSRACLDGCAWHGCPCTASATQEELSHVLKRKAPPKIGGAFLFRALGNWEL